MANNVDWLPNARDGRLAMAKRWLLAPETRAALWGIPAGVVRAPAASGDTAKPALAAAKNETARTPAAGAECKPAEEDSAAKMRGLKLRRFLTPPLTDADDVARGLKPRGRTPAPFGPPAAGVKIACVTGSPAGRANKGCRIRYGVLSPDETPPAEPDEPRTSFFAGRKKDVRELGFGDSGKTAYFAVQIGNDGKKGNRVISFRVDTVE
jgi:hypothetical protein